MERPDISKGWAAVAILFMSLLWEVLSSKKTREKMRETKYEEACAAYVVALSAGDPGGMRAAKCRMQKYGP